MSFFYIGLLIILTIVGLLEIFRLSNLLFFRSSDNTLTLILIPLKKHEEKIEYLLRSAVSKLKWLGINNNQKIICLDYGTDKETKKICEIFKKRYDFIEICPADAFENFF
ncbi:MAG: hypothetical protein LBF33_00940 [Oscillospiraceae bacterium]|jgi:hypothetical protein|nr:hypothetical protein [Oscillospiraceae bacterium]